MLFLWLVSQRPWRWSGESGPGRAGLFLCRLQPLTQRECLLLCHAASHSGSSWRMTADIIVPPACSRNSTGRAYLTIRSPDWLQHYRGGKKKKRTWWLRSHGCMRLTWQPAPKVRLKTEHFKIQKAFLLEVNVFKEKKVHRGFKVCGNQNCGKKATTTTTTCGWILQQFTSLHTRWHW